MIIKRLSPCCGAFVRRGLKIAQGYNKIYCTKCGKLIEQPLDTLYPSIEENNN